MALSPRINEISMGLSIVFHADVVAAFTLMPRLVAGTRPATTLSPVMYSTVTGDAQLYILYLLRPFW